MNAVVVPSYKRAELLYEREYSLAWLTAQDRYPVFLAVRESEQQAYKKVINKYRAIDGNIDLICIPDEDVDTLGQTLDWLVQYFHVQGFEKLALYDDDLIFSYRDWTCEKLPRLHPHDMDMALDAQFVAISDEVPHVCLRHRMFGQNCTHEIDYLKRGMWTHGVHLPTVAPNSKLRFAWEQPTMTDFHFQLSVVSEGYKNATINSYLADDAVGPYKNAGGCNTYRTDQVRTEAAYALKRKFGKAVTLREKRTPTGNCLDVTVFLSRAVPKVEEVNPFLEGVADV